MSCEGKLQILTLKRHDTLPKPKGTLVESDPDNPGSPAPVNITGATIQFIMVTDDALRTVKVNSPATIVSGPAGTFEYTWVPANTDTAGNYLAEFQITFSGGAKISLPADDTFKIIIKEDYNNA